MPDEVSAERVAAVAAMAGVLLTADDAVRIARAVTPPMRRIAAANIALDMEVEPATFVAIQRKDAGL